MNGSSGIRERSTKVKVLKNYNRLLFKYLIVKGFSRIVDKAVVRSRAP